MESRLVLAVRTVTSTLDNGAAGTLRDIVENVAQAGDIINFNFQNQTITLDAARGDIDISKNLIIEGPGTPDLITISGNNQTRIFNVSAGLTVAINKLTLMRGSSSTGGAIMGSGTLTLDQVWLNDNTAADDGGAVWWGPTEAGLVTLNKCHFQRNTATAGKGGALYSNVTATLTETAFTSNKAKTRGGAVVVDSDMAGVTLSVTKCTFNSNLLTESAAENGGGAIFTTVPTTVDGPTTKSTFADNNAGLGEGGAIAFQPIPNSSSSLTIHNATVKNNTGRYGGGVYSEVDNTQGTVSVSINGSLFDSNHSPTAAGQPLGYGGGLLIDHSTSGGGSASASVTNSTFYNNDTAGRGGGIALLLSTFAGSTSSATLTNLTVTKNLAGEEGGGLYVSQTSPDPVVTNSIIAGNLFLLEQQPQDGVDVKGTVASGGFNLIGVEDGSLGWVASDRMGSWGTPLNPGLDPTGPQDNGGNLTWTIKLMPGSVAYQNGKPELAGTKDQRGRIRRNDGINRVSIGAYDPDALAPVPGGD